jgi:hypothetical protein
MESNRKGSKESNLIPIELAAENLRIVRRLTQEINEGKLDVLSVDEKLVLSSLIVLDAECNALQSDIRGLAQIIQEAAISGTAECGVLEQLARIAFELSADPHHQNDRKLLDDSFVAALKGLLACRLNNEKIDVEACAATVRELASFELTRITGHNRAVFEFERALGILKEHPGYPPDEQRWLTARAWETSQMFYKTGRNEESRQWAGLALQCAQGNAALETYIPRIESFISTL